MSAPRIVPSSTSRPDTGRPGQRAKTVATRLSPEELQEVEAAAERDGKSLAEWLREVALRSARERPADPIELLWAELMANPLCPAESVPRNRSGGSRREAVVTRFRAEDSRPGRCPEATKSPQAGSPDKRDTDPAFPSCLSQSRLFALS